MRTHTAPSSDSPAASPGVARNTHRGSRLGSLVAYAALATSYAAALGISRVLRGRSRRRQKKTSRVVVIGRFDSENWFRSHILPLASSGVDEVIVVTEAPQAAPEGVRVVCPPRWARRILGRGPSKLTWLMLTALRDKPDLYMGYCIFPAAWTALIVARLFGRPACYQMTGGPIEIVGGGLESENRLAVLLRKPSASLDRLGKAVVREFDLVIVRGKNAKEFLTTQGFTGRAAIIPGSIDADRLIGNGNRCYDLVFVGRLTEMKQPLLFVEVVAGVLRHRPDARAALVGDGPLMAEVRRLASKLDLADRLDVLGKTDDVETVVGDSRVFVLTSRSEGLSIAMAEGMAAGAVPVVADVGDLADLVSDGVNGFLVEPNNVDDFARRVVALLADADLWSRCSRAATASSRGYMNLDVVSDRWRRCLRDVGQAGDTPPEGEQPK